VEPLDRICPTRQYTAGLYTGGLVRDGRGESAGLTNRSVRGVHDTFLKLRCSLLKPAKQRNSLKNHEKRQALAGLSGPGSCKLPGSAFRDSLIRLATRDYLKLSLRLSLLVGAGRQTRL